MKTPHKFLCLAIPVIVLGIGFWAALIIAGIFLFLSELQLSGICILCAFLSRFIARRLARRAYPLLPILVSEGYIKRRQVDERVLNRITVQSIDIESKAVPEKEDSKSTTYKTSDEMKGGDGL